MPSGFLRVGQLQVWGGGPCCGGRRRWSQGLRPPAVCCRVRRTLPNPKAGRWGLAGGQRRRGVKKMRHQVPALALPYLCTAAARDVWMGCCCSCNDCFGVLLALFPLVLVVRSFEEPLGALELPESPAWQAFVCWKPCEEWLPPKQLGCWKGASSSCLGTLPIFPGQAAASFVCKKWCWIWKHRYEPSEIVAQLHLRNTSAFCCSQEMLTSVGKLLGDVYSACRGLSFLGICISSLMKCDDSSQRGNLLQTTEGGELQRRQAGYCLPTATPNLEWEPGGFLTPFVLSCLISSETSIKYKVMNLHKPTHHRPVVLPYF